MKIKISSIIKILNGKIINNIKNTHPKYITSVSIDSRKTLKKSIFFAIIGKKYDGHIFLKKIKKKSFVAVVSKKIQDLGILTIKVPETTIALGKLARWYRNKYKIPFIGITGSIGKTTTKRFIYNILNTKYKVLVSKKNYNNNIGVPLTLFKLNSSYQIGVVEIGTNNFGEIKYLSSIVNPKISVITSIYEVHLSKLKNLDNIKKEKSNIFSILDKKGIAILRYSFLKENFWKKILKKKKILTFGKSKKSDYFFKIIEVNYRKEFQILKILNKKNEYNIKINLLGEYNGFNLSSAIAACSYFNIPKKNIEKSLAYIKPYERRFNILKGKKSSKIIDDSYSANFFSLKENLKILKNFKNKKIVVLGDMFELGKKTKYFHIKSGKIIKKINPVCFLAIGKYVKYSIKSYGKGSYFFKNKKKLIKKLINLLEKDIIVFIKGSNKMNMNEIVKEIVL